MVDQANFTAETLASKLKDVLNDAAVLSDMSAKALGFATPDAADHLARVAIEAVAAQSMQKQEPAR
jgi:UDP-N-acetylglucosamine:LPS N-acetylglucosamine transferase